MSPPRTLLSLLLLLSGTPLVSGATLTVAPGDSLQAAADRAQPGDTVLVLPGTYGAVVTARSGTAAAPIRFVAQTPWAARITGPDFMLWQNRGDYVDIEGFDLVGVGGIAPLGAPGQNGIVNYGSHLHIRRNHIHGLRSYACDTGPALSGHGVLTGVYGTPGSAIDVTENVIHDNGSPDAAPCSHGPHGIYQVHDGLVANNMVYNNRSYGIHLWHTPHHVVVANNLVFNNGRGGIVVGGQEEVAHDNLILNNIVLDNRGHGLFEEGWNTPTNRFLNNLSFRNTGENVLMQQATPEGTITVDPGFLNYQRNGSGNYHLGADSPARRAGRILSQVPCDLDGRSRDPGVAYDLGPYTFTSPGPCQGTTGLEGPGLSDTDRTALVARLTRDARASIAAQRASLPRVLTPPMPTFPAMPGRPGT